MQEETARQQASLAGRDDPRGEKIPRPPNVIETRSTLNFIAGEQAYRLSDGKGDGRAEPQSLVYNARRASQWRLAFICIAVGCIGLFFLKGILQWLSGGTMPEPRAFIALISLLGIPAGIVFLVNAVRGLPRLTATAQGVRLESSLGAKWANWDSLEPFAIRTFRRTNLASAKLAGTNASKRVLRAKSFAIPDHFHMPIDALAAELNTARAQALAAHELPPASANAPHEAIIGLADFRLPWVTFTLLAVLIGVFAIENIFAVTPGRGLDPSLATLFALGGLSRPAVLSGEWYRLFTAPLLHGGVAHIVGNSIALVLGGWLLERLVGRLWFFAFFVIGALGGSLCRWRWHRLT